MILLRTAINDLIPHQLRSFIASKLEAFFSKYQANSNVSMKFCRWDISYEESNELFHAALAYLPTQISHTYKSLQVGKLENQKHFELAVDGSEDVVDEFEGVKFTWKLDEGSKEEPNDLWKYKFVLTFNEKQKQRVLDRYLPHVLKTYEAIKDQRKIVILYTRLAWFWNESELSHPATFESLALTPELKKDIIDDLERFLRRRDLYRKVGKPWKRGYLLYGPPGTGKSSLIAAMANYLKFNVYDLQLSSVSSDLDLKRCMSDASNRCIIVIEDIDCNKEVHARSKPNGPSDYQDSDSDKVCFPVLYVLLIN